MNNNVGIKVFAIIVAIVCAIMSIVCLERVKVGRVGVVYTATGVQEETLSAGWHWLSPLKHVQEYPISQQKITFSSDPADYDAKEHDDWHIDAPTSDGATVKINLSVNYNFVADRVVELYTRFGGVDGDELVENYIQNEIVASVKEVTQRYPAMDIYSTRIEEANQEITEHLNDKLEAEYGIHVSRTSIIKVTLSEDLMAKLNEKENAKQEAQIASLQRETALAQAETDKAKAQAAADVAKIQAESDAEITKIQAEAEANANMIISDSITDELIRMTEAEARLVHGWVTVQGADAVVVG